MTSIRTLTGYIDDSLQELSEIDGTENERAKIQGYLNEIEIELDNIESENNDIESALADILSIKETIGEIVY
jgi:hypothetical protein